MLAIVFTLLMLVFLRIVLGFDNLLLHLSIESKRVEPSHQQTYERLVLSLRLYCVSFFFLWFFMRSIQALGRSVCEIDWPNVIEAKVGCLSKIVRTSQSLLP